MEKWNTSKRVFAYGNDTSLLLTLGHRRPVRGLYHNEHGADITVFLVYNFQVASHKTVG